MYTPTAGKRINDQLENLNITIIHIYQVSIDKTRYFHPPVLSLQLTATTHQLRASSTDGQLARLLDPRLECNRVTGLPHLRDECLARQYDARKSDLDVLERSELL